MLAFGKVPWLYILRESYEWMDRSKYRAERAAGLSARLCGCDITFRLGGAPPSFKPSTACSAALMLTSPFSKMRWYKDAMVFPVIFLCIKPHIHAVLLGGLYCMCILFWSLSVNEHLPKGRYTSCGLPIVFFCFCFFLPQIGTRF